MYYNNITAMNSFVKMRVNCIRIPNGLSASYMYGLHGNIFYQNKLIYTSNLPILPIQNAFL